MVDDKKNQLVRRPGSEIATPGRRTNRVMQGMTRDILARAKAQELNAARFRIGEYELREPDYRQIMRWAEAGGMRPEEVLERLAGSSVDPFWQTQQFISFSVEDGSILSVAWDFERLPFIPDSWEPGLLIRELAFKGHWPDAAIALRPVLPRLQTLWCGQLALEFLDLFSVPRLTDLYCENNSLTELDLSPVLGLTVLSCSDNNLTELDLSPVSGLTELYCFYTDLTELDLSPVSGLTVLGCGDSKLTELDLSPVPRLTALCCLGGNFIELDLSLVSGLTDLYFQDTNLTELDLSPVPGLTELECGNNYNLTELDLSPVPGLTKLGCDKSLRLRNAPRGLKTKGFVLNWASTSYDDEDIPF